MESTGTPAEPIATGTWATAKQSFRDLFVWPQRVEIRNEYGEARTEWQKPKPLRNPISLFMQLSASGWLYFIVGFAAWTADAFDFHALSIQTVKLADYYETSKTQISTAITLTLLLRSVGAAIFGLLGDRYATLQEEDTLPKADRAQIRTQVADGCQHDHPGCPADRHHLQRYVPAVPWSS